MSCFSGTCIGADYTDEERLLLQAIDRYKRTHQRPFLTWREVLHIVHSLGYEKTRDAGPLPAPGEIGPAPS